MSEELLSCPFCGSQQLNLYRANQNTCWVECDSCGSSAPSSAHRAVAIAQWNSRPAPQPAAFHCDDDKE